MFDIFLSHEIFVQLDLENVNLLIFSGYLQQN